MRTLKFLIKSLVVILLVIFVFPVAFSFVSVLGTMHEFNNSNAHALEYYAEDLKITIPEEGELIREYHFSLDEEFYMYLVYQMNEDIDKTEYTNLGFSKTDEYNESINSIIDAVNSLGAMEEAYKTKVTNQQYIKYISPKENFDYYLIYDSNLNLFIILYSWNA